MYVIILSSTLFKEWIK